MKFKTIQATRAVAANAVMLSHLLIVEHKDGHGFTVLPERSHVGAYGVDLFFVLSGFIMAAIASGESWRGFLVARATRIFPPYWFYSGVVLIVALIAPGIVNSSFAHAPSLWRSFLLVPDTVEPLLAVGWTLTHEAYFYLVFAALLATGYVNIGGLCAWAVVVIAVRLALPIAPTQEAAPVLAVVLHPLTLEFIGGACAGLAVRSGVTTRAVLAFVVGAGTLIVFLGSADNPSSLVTDTAQWGRVLKIGFPFVLMVYGLAATERAGGANHLPDWVVRLGDASYSTYLTHVLVLSAIGRCFAFLPVHNFPIEVFFVAVCIAGTNAAGLLSYRWLERPALFFSRRVLRKESGTANAADPL
jgi:peptidoglycan/LPS O-acetylase OafA/YrhL